MSKSKHYLIGIVVFIFTFTVFILSPVHQVTDSHYSMLLSESIYRYRSFKLDRFFTLPLDQSIYPGVTGTDLPVHIEKIKDHLFYYYPPGSAILSIPYVVILNHSGISAVSPDLKYNVMDEKRLEISLAALLMAVLCSIIFFTANLQLPVNLSLLITSIAAFGTQIWSTASRALWGHTWLILLLGIVVYHLLSSESQKKPLRPVLLSSLLGWMFFVRPTSAVFIVGVSILCLIKMQRKAFVHYVLTGIIWLISFIGFSYYHYGKPLPTYYGHRLSMTTFWTGLSGTLISPSRGLFILVPLTLFVIYIVLRYWRSIPFRGLVLLAISSICGHILVISAFQHWWAGHSFGPRFSTDIIPLWILLGVLGTKAMIDRNRTNPNHRVTFFAKTAVTCLILISVLIHASGALSRATWRWNQIPVDIDKAPDRVWDWSRPQFLAKFTDSR